jgi:hypothetical protein
VNRESGQSDFGRGQSDFGRGQKLKNSGQKTILSESHSFNAANIRKKGPTWQDAITTSNFRRTSNN